MISPMGLRVPVALRRPALWSRQHVSSNGECSSPLDVTLLANLDTPCGLDAILAKHRLRIGDRVSLGPEMFHPQSQLAWIAGIYVYESSAPLHVAHRRIGQRTQSRAELRPGSCLLRGELARQSWTLAIPPLLGARPDGTERLWSERTRKFALLADVDESDERISYEFHSHTAREPS